MNLKGYLAKLKGYRTIIVNAILSIAPILEVIAAYSAEVRPYVPESLMGWHTVAVIVANIGLRCITTTPVGRKE